LPLHPTSRSSNKDNKDNKDNNMTKNKPKSLVKDIESEEEFRELVSGSSLLQPVICQFTASWSRACIEGAGQYEELAQQQQQQQLQNALFCRVNVDDLDELLLLVEDEYHASIADLPTFLVFVNAQVTATQAGHDNLQAFITAALSNASNSSNTQSNNCSQSHSPPAAAAEPHWKKLVRAPSHVLAGMIPATKPCCQPGGGGCSSTRESTFGSTTSSAATTPRKKLSALEGMTPATKSCCHTNDNGGGNGASSMNMNDTSNVLVQYTLQDLDRRAETNFWLGLLCLGVCSVNVVLIYLNYTKHHVDKEGNQPHVSKYAFHMLEFWTSHIYAIAEAFALVTSPKTMLHIYNKPNLLKLLLFFNVVNSMVPALLITLDFKYFEKTAHELEFINSFTLSFITMILLASLLSPTSPQDLVNMGLSAAQEDSNSDQDNLSSLGMGLVACLVAASNFVIYNAGQEAAAHYLEFTFNIVVSLITFWFCMDNRFVAQMEIGQILYGRHQNCIFCQIRGTEAVNTSKKWNSLLGGDNTAVRVGATESVASTSRTSNSIDLEAAANTALYNETTPLLMMNGNGGGGGCCSGGRC
jgi:Thioredoxin